MVEDIKDSGSWAQATRFYDYLRAVENMNNLGFVLKALDAMNNSRLWLTWMTQGPELKGLDGMDN